MGRLFGTDGIRGVVNAGLDAELAYKVGLAAAQVLSEEKKDGIVISASHNPFEHNGIKIFNGQGFKLSDELGKKLRISS